MIGLGLGLITCSQEITSNAKEYIYLMPAYTDYIRGAPYCVACCGTNPDLTDVWNFSCPVDFTTSSTSNLYGFEFRFAKNRFSGDAEVASCRLERTGCQLYDGGGGIVDNCTLTFLTGYTLTLEVVQYNSNFQYWNGIASCSVVAHESTSHMKIGEKFHEEIVLVRRQDLNLVDGTKLAVLWCLMMFLLYVVLYFCRRKHCIVCAKKLVLGYERCYMCVFVGAHPPDPRMVRALEEKSLFIQDEPPERFPGSKRFVAFVRLFSRIGIYACLRRPKDATVTPVADEETKEQNNMNSPSIDAAVTPQKAKTKRYFSKSPEVNPNLLPYPDHIIYAAVAHHNPPPPTIDTKASNKDKIMKY